MHVVTGAIDERLNSDRFIVPGLGDYGDRYYGTQEHIWYAVSVSKFQYLLKL